MFSGRTFKRSLPRGDGRFAKGKESIFICDRSGMKFLRSEAVMEPGTGFIVQRDESDGEYSAVAHPQLDATPDRPEGIGLAWSRPEVTLSVATPTSVWDGINLVSVGVG